MKTKLFSLILALVFYSLPSQFLVNDSFETDALGTLPSGYTLNITEQELQIKKW